MVFRVAKLAEAPRELSTTQQLTATEVIRNIYGPMVEGTFIVFQQETQRYKRVTIAPETVRNATESDSM